MPRKKIQRRQTPKGKKLSAKKVQGSFRLVTELEKEFKKLPNRLAALCQRELVMMKQAEKKLQQQLKQLTAKRVVSENKQKKFLGKSTATAKKQLAQLEKTVGNLKKSSDLLAKQLFQLVQQYEEWSQKQARFVLLGKELAKWEKQIIQPVKTPAKKKMTSPVNQAVKKKKVSSAKRQPHPEAASQESASHLETLSTETVNPSKEGMETIA